MGRDFGYKQTKITMSSPPPPHWASYMDLDEIHDSEIIESRLWNGFDKKRIFKPHERVLIAMELRTVPGPPEELQHFPRPPTELLYGPMMKKRLELKILPVLTLGVGLFAVQNLRLYIALWTQCDIGKKG